MNLIQNIFNSGRKNGGKTAIIYNNKKISYSSLEKATWGYSNLLISNGIKQNDKIAILLEDTPSHIALHLAIMMIGAVPISLNTRLTKIEILEILKDATTSLFVSNPSILRKNKIIKTDINKITKYFYAYEIEYIPKKYKYRPTRMVSYDSDKPAFMLYSSGTTGKPKGVIHGYKTLEHVDSIYKETFQVHAGDKIFCSSKLFFAYALGNGYLGPLKKGLTIILYSKWPTISKIVKILDSHKIKIFFSVPSIYRKLYEKKNIHTYLKKIKYFISAGEQLPHNLLVSWNKTIRNVIFDCYGTSETLVLIIVSKQSNKDNLTIKKPVKDAKYRLCTNISFKKKGKNYGILWLKHPANALGYWKRPNEQSSTFKNSWINTRDIWHIDKEGSWHYQGRSDNLLKIASQWVNPAELENLIMNVREIKEVATTTFNTDKGNKRLALFLVLYKKSYNKLISIKITKILSELPKYKQPQIIKILDELPYTATGKIKRSALRELLKD